MKCCDISPSDLRTPVEIQEESRTATGSGGFDTSWSQIAGSPTRAKIEFRSGSEDVAYGLTRDSAFYRVIIRYFSADLENKRLIVNGDTSRPYNIRAADNIEFRNKYWLLICERGMPS